MTGGRQGTGSDLFLASLPERLQALGVGVAGIVLHSNRTVMLSLSRGVLRLHRGYAYAPDPVLRAIVRFLDPRVPRAARRAAERELLAFPIEAHAPPAPRRRPAERILPADRPLLERLQTRHRELNADHFGGALAEIPIRISGRMRTRLGELVVELATGRATEIAISRRHVLRHSWAEVEHTLLHEMVHQWQAETEVAVDHGAEFRRKAREVGIAARARRAVAR